MHLKKLFKKKECLLHKGPPVYWRKSLSWNIFFRCILSLKNAFSKLALVDFQDIGGLAISGMENFEY
jgi:hypothetical protein